MNHRDKHRIILCLLIATLGYVAIKDAVIFAKSSPSWVFELYLYQFMPSQLVALSAFLSLAGLRKTIFEMCLLSLGCALVLPIPALLIFVISQSQPFAYFLVQYLFIGMTSVLPMLAVWLAGYALWSIMWSQRLK